VLKSSESNHEYFEELCALWILGQISQEEYEALLPHLRSCASCRTSHFEFAEILHEHLPLLDPQKELFADSPNIAFHDSSYKQRFLQRAQEQGIEFTNPALTEAPGGQRSSAANSSRHWVGKLFWPPSVPVYASLLLLALGLAIGFAGQKMRQRRVLAGSAVEMVRLREEIARLHLRTTELLKSHQPSEAQDRLSGPTKALSQDNSGELAALRAKLSLALRSYEVESTRSRFLEEQQQKSLSELASLREELAALKNKGQNEDKLREIQSALRQATDEVERLRRARNADAAVLATQEAYIRELDQKLNAQGDSLDRERELLTAGRDIRDLMGARNLHIIDVADVDSQGTKHPFGRVFYTEGKSLLFYAYDLEWKKKSQERYSFQAWGQRESKSGSAQSLGIFFVDDQTQNRWILKYDDPSVLAEIDAVFVTLEPKGGSQKPKGQQLMYAYLKANPNHP
jgi:hypothetical protein